MRELIDGFAQSVRLPGCKVRSFEDVILLCGGPYKNQEDGKYLSLRDFILKRLPLKSSPLTARIYLAEDIQDWFRGSHFDDLLSFEQFISEIASIVLLVVESPGSIAELGAFAVADKISQKLVVVISEENNSSSSFISLGPVERLRRKNKRNVLIYPWTAPRIGGQISTDEADNFFDNLVEDLEEFSDPGRLTYFDTSHNGHRAALMCDAMDIFGALQVTEIGQLLERAGCPENIAQDNERTLFVLQKLDLVRAHSSGANTYYTCEKSAERPFVEYAYTDEAGRDFKDRAALKLLVREQHKKDPRRLSIIRRTQRTVARVSL